MFFHFTLFQRKTNDKIFQKMQKTPFCPFFEQNRIFFKILFLPVFLILVKHYCARFSKIYFANSKWTDTQAWIYGTLLAKALDPKHVYFSYFEQCISYSCFIFLLLHQHSFSLKLLFAAFIYYYLNFFSILKQNTHYNLTLNNN